MRAWLPLDCRFYKESDLSQFWNEYIPLNKGETIKVVGPNHGRAGVEAALDIEYGA